MPRLCLDCDKEIIVSAVRRPTETENVYEIDINVLCGNCKLLEKIKEEKKELNKKLREMNRKQKHLEEIISRTRKNKIGSTQQERDWLEFLRSNGY